jgi:hypothetical protein
MAFLDRNCSPSLGSTNSSRASSVSFFLLSLAVNHARILKSCWVKSTSFSPPVTRPPRAGGLHDATRTLARLVDDLYRVNLQACSPPLERGETDRISRSIHWREPCHPNFAGGSRTPSASVLEAVEYLQDLADGRWVRGKAGATRWAGYNALLERARTHGWQHPRGVEVEVDYRTLAQMAGLGSTTTIARFVRSTPLVEVLWTGRGHRGSKLLLVMPQKPHRKGDSERSDESASTVHSIHGVSIKKLCGSSEHFRHFRKLAYKLRWSTSGRKDKCGLSRSTRRVRQLATGAREGTNRIGKSRGALLSAMYQMAESTNNMGKRFTRGELIERLGRSANAISKELRWLCDANLVVKEDPFHDVDE